MEGSGTDASELEKLKATLAATGSDYVLLSALPETKIKARFIGQFDGREVVWDAAIYTLVRHQQECGRVPTATNFSLRGLMLIEPASPHTYRLDVALNVPLIDEPVIKKTIVMVRNYRRLRIGLHTWGMRASHP
jgi:hypothetical protein